MGFKIDDGAFSSVYEVKDLTTDKVLVIKIVSETNVKNFYFLDPVRKVCEDK
jgi:hypothetical protein